MQERLHSLIEYVDGLLTGLQEEQRAHAEAIAQVAPEHHQGAENLVHYAYLRSHDQRRLQSGLESLGVTRLSTAEPSVKARLEAARNVLGALRGEGIIYTADSISNAFADADEMLEANASRLLGEADPDVHSRIMVTLPTEAAEDPDLVRSYVDAGMDLARINCAHDGPAAWEKMISNVRAAAAEAGKKVRVSMDLAGPKIRTGAIASGPAVGRARVTRDEAGQVLTPSKLWITRRAVGLGGEQPAPLPPSDLPGRPPLPVQVDGTWFELLQVGSEIKVNDNRGSKRNFTVTRVGPDAILAEGSRNAYIAEGTLLETDYQRCRATGIAAVVQRMRLSEGDTVILTTDQSETILEPGVTPRVGCTLPLAVQALKVGEKVLFDDGAIAAVVKEKRCGGTSGTGHHTEALLEVTRAKAGGVNLAAYKGINLPDTDLPLPSLTDEDVANLGFVARHADIAAVSFIRTAEDVQYVLDTLAGIADEIADPEAAERARNLGVVLKIETIPGFENLPTILMTGMKHTNLGLMIARGDLAVELGFARMAEVPQQIMTMAEAAHIPVIMATQVLENLAKSGLPSRAEITDAAFALRAEAVMLNKGPHITDAIGILVKLSRRLGRSQRKNRILLRHIHSWDNQ